MDSGGPAAGQAGWHAWRQGQREWGKLEGGQGGDEPVSVAPAEVERPEADEVVVPDTPWVTIVWNDPVNLMSYVTYVFQKVFGYAKPRAEKLMLDVHHKGKAVVSSGTRESMERDAEILHGYGLWATVSHDR
jgi:ATP-dependent Clp protease adaptor protein ClpS